MSTPDKPDLLAEFERFRDEFLEHTLDGIPEDEKQIWRDLR